MPIILSNNLLMKKVTLTAPVDNNLQPGGGEPQYVLSTQLGDWYFPSQSQGAA